MFRNDAQICCALKILLRNIKGGRLWTDTGPSDAAVHASLNPVPWSHGEIIMLQVAFDFWNGDGKAKFASVLNKLDYDNTKLVTGLWIACNDGAEAVDRWIEDNR